MTVEKIVSASDLYLFNSITAARMSPDGRCVAYTVKAADKESGKTRQNIYMASGEKKSLIRRFTYGNWNDTSPAWSPDGRELAFVSDRDNGRPGLYIIPADGGEARPLTIKDGAFSAPAWSPDGRSIAFCYREKPAGDDKGHEKERDSLPLFRDYDKVFFKADGAGYIPAEKWHILTVNVKSGKTTALTHGEHEEFMPVWTPDGKDIVFYSNRSADPGLNPYEWEYYSIPAKGGNIAPITTINGSKGAFSLSPDGKWLAFEGTEGRGKWWKKTELWLKDLAGTGTCVSLTKDHDFTLGSLTLNDSGGVPGFGPVWADQGKRILFQVSARGATFICSADPSTGEVRELMREKGVMGGLSLDGSGRRGAYIFGDMSRPYEIAFFEPGAPAKTLVAEINGAMLRKKTLPAVEEIEFESASGTSIQGWIMKPPGFDPSKKYPSILEIHGGPRLQYGYHFMHEFNYLASQGYVVYFCNPRGSQGYGEKHTASIWNNWGTVDFEDLMRFADIMAAKPYIDMEKMGVTGGSYGGYMTNWIIGHTHRFAAAVSQRSVSNLISMWGTSDVNWNFQYEFGETPPWEDTDNYWRQSPMKYMGNAKTPTMIIHSENDFRCSAEQGEQVYVALKYLGVDTRFIRFPEESHGLSRQGRTDRRIKRLELISGWFDKYLKG